MNASEDALMSRLHVIAKELVSMGRNEERAHWRAILDDMRAQSRELTFQLEKVQERSRHLEAGTRCCSRMHARHTRID